MKELVKLFCSNYWQNPQIVAAVYDFQKQPLKLFGKKGVLKMFANFIGKHMCWSLFLVKFQALRLRTCNFIKKKFQHRSFAIRFAKFLRAFILKNISEWLLLYFHYNSHHHYYYHHFQYHSKMYLYRLRILLTIPLLLIVIWSPVCFT